MFDLDNACVKAATKSRELFPEEENVERALSELLASKTPEVRKKRLLVNLGVLCGEAFIGPQVIHLDIIGTCNINCIFCRDHSPWIKNRETWREMEMPYELIARLVDEGEQLGASVMPLLGAGEPLMHTQFVPIIEKLKSSPLRFEIFTNGLLFDKDKLDLFLDAHRGRLHFSICAADDEVYIKFRPKLKGTPYQDLERHIRYLTENREPGLKVIVVQVLNNINFHQVIPMMERAIALGVDEVQYKLTEYGNFGQSLMLTPEQFHSVELELRHAKHLAAVAGVDVHDNIDFQIPNYNQETGNYAEGLFDEMGCHLGWELVRIRRDGEISFCCALKFLDHVGEKPLADYWWGEQMQAARIAGRGFPVGKNLKLPDGGMLRDKQCDYCYNYITNFHSRDELSDLGLLPLVNKNR